MKFKISWPAGIILSLLAFIIFILYFVFKVTFLPEYDHHLVSEDYYKDELNYQQEIDRLNNAASLEKNIQIVKSEKGIEFIFPSQFEEKDIEGTIYFQRLSNQKIDFSLPIQLENHAIFIEDAKLVKGRWDIRVIWKANNVDYLLKEKITY